MLHRQGLSFGIADRLIQGWPLNAADQVLVDGFLATMPVTAGASS